MWFQIFILTRHHSRFLIQEIYLFNKSKRNRLQGYNVIVQTLLILKKIKILFLYIECLSC